MVTVADPVVMVVVARFLEVVIEKVTLLPSSILSVSSDRIEGSSISSVWVSTNEAVLPEQLKLPKVQKREVVQVRRPSSSRAVWRAVLRAEDWLEHPVIPASGMDTEAFREFASAASVVEKVGC